MKTAPNHTLAKLRQIIDRTQEQFAVMLGVSKDAIVSAENGRNRLTAALAYRIHGATGADEASLMENTGLITYSGTPGSKCAKTEYTRDSFDHWRKEVFDDDLTDPARRKKAAHMFFDYIEGRLEVLLIAATRPGVKGRDRFPAVVQSFEGWMQQVYEDFELAKEVDEVLREETSYPVPNRLSVASLRDLMKNGNPMGFKFKDSKKYKDTDIVDVEYESYEGWNGGFIPRPQRTQSKPPKSWRKSPKKAAMKEMPWDFGELFTISHVTDAPNLPG